ncbi:hypothetical protein D8911_09020 [Levilactobacillus brevis]|nr:hypothetical protein D8911_09020 [Levilactobacillus brevis]
MKPENVRMALSKLFDLNNKRAKPFSIDDSGMIHGVSLDELCDENFELLADIADLLGMEELYKDPRADDHFVD